MDEPNDRAAAWSRFVSGWGLIALGVGLLVLSDRIGVAGGVWVVAGVSVSHRILLAAGLLPLAVGIWVVRRWARQVRRSRSPPGG